MNKIINNFPAYAVEVLTDRNIEFLMDHGYGILVQRKVQLNTGIQNKSQQRWGDLPKRMEEDTWERSMECLRMMLGADEISIKERGHAFNVIVAPYPSSSTPGALSTVRVHVQINGTIREEYQNITRRIAGIDFLDVNNAMHHFAMNEFDLDEVNDALNALYPVDFRSKERPDDETRQPTSKAS